MIIFDIHAYASYEDNISAADNIIYLSAADFYVCVINVCCHLMHEINTDKRKKANINLQHTQSHIILVYSINTLRVYIYICCKGSRGGYVWIGFATLQR